MKIFLISAQFNKLGVFSTNLLIRTVKLLSIQPESCTEEKEHKICYESKKV